MIKCLSWDIRPSLTQPYDLNSRISRSSPIKLFFFLLVHAGQVWICPLSYPNKAKTYPAKLCCDIIQLISVWWSRGKLEQTLICITSMILLAKSSAILSRKSTTLFLNRTQQIISIYFYKSRALYVIWKSKIWGCINKCTSSCILRASQSSKLRP